MIRINLLGVPKSRRGGGKRAPAVSIPSGGGPNIVILGLFVMVLAGGAMWYLWTLAEKDLDNLQKECIAANAENQRLAVVKANYEQNRAKADEFERHVKIINQLKAQQAGPLNLLDTVANTVNNTDAVWLETMTDDGKNITFTGMALSPDSVADLMANLQKTGYFKSVEIKETAQDPSAKNLQAFRFELNCEKIPEPKIPEPPKGPGPKRG